jgi:hypothetical protein
VRPLKTPPDFKFFSEALSYDPHTGLLLWKARPDYHFASAAGQRRWNDLLAGRPAGSLGSRGYVSVRIGAHRYAAHRIAWLLTHGHWPAEFLDHINLNKADNRLSNLRECSHSQNMANCSMRSNNSLGFKGVTFDPRNQKYSAKIQHKGRWYHLGAFDAPAAAHAAYTAKSLQLNVNFARAA